MVSFVRSFRPHARAVRHPSGVCRPVGNGEIKHLKYFLFLNSASALQLGWERAVT